MATRTHLTNCIILFSLALGVRIAIIAFHGFDGLYGQDAFAYFDFAGDILYFIETFNPPPPFFWSIGYPLQLAIGMGILGVTESVALGTSILMGSLLPILVYSLGLQLQLRLPYAFFAGLLISFSGQALQSSLVIMSDIPALFWSLISVVSLLQYMDGSKKRWLALCGFAVSIACITRWIYLILPTIYVLVLILHWKRHIRWKDTILTILVSLMPVMPQLIYNQINPPTLLNHSWVQGWAPLNVLAQNFITVEGTLNYEKINALFYASPIYDLSYLSPLLTIFVLCGLLFVLRRRNLHTLIVLAWFVTPYVFLAGIPSQNIRFPLIIFPIVTILVGFGLQWIMTITKPVRWVAIGLALVGFSHTAINGFDYANSFVEHHQSEKQVVTWLDGKIPDDAKLYTFGSTLILQHYTDYSVIEIFYETPDTLNQRWFRGRSDYLLLNLWQIENQWQGRAPQANYHWFRDDRGLVHIERFRNLTLFEANP